METQSLTTHYGIFLKNLEIFKEFLESSPEMGSAIAEKFADLEQVYREKILSLTQEKGDRETPENIARWQSLLTETHRTIRLLQTDIAFLQASRQSSTQQQRKITCLTKINRLIGYCQQILTEENGETSC
ncbi:MAG: heterocyst frequency control protein PatD [Spirulina sp.]